jgi:hypothetical protein
MSEDWEARLRAVPWVYRGDGNPQPDYAAMAALVATAVREAITEREETFDDSGKPWRRHEMTWENSAKVAALGVVDDDEPGGLTGTAARSLACASRPGGTAAEQAARERRRTAIV